MRLFLNTKRIGTRVIGSLNGKFDAFSSTNPYLMHGKHSMRLFSNTKGIRTGVIESLNWNYHAFPETKSNLTHTKHSIEFATQGYLESKAL